MTIHYDATKKRWLVSHKGQPPFGSSRNKDVLIRRYPEAKVVEG